MEKKTITNNNKNDWQGDWRDLISNVGPTSPHSLSACVWHQVPYVHFYHFVNLHNVVFFPVYKVLFKYKHYSHRLWVNLSLVPCSRYFPPLSGRISRCPLPSLWSRCGTRTRWFQINLEGLKMTIVKYLLTKLRTAIGTMPRRLEYLTPRTL